MTGMARALGRQLLHPTGFGGRLTGAVMDMANRKPTRLALDLLAPGPHERVLDAGCGTGAAAEQLLHRSTCQIDCVDWSPTMLRRAEARLGHYRKPPHLHHVTLHLGQVGALPFIAGQFDAVLALNMLYFCDSQGVMVGDLRRMLRPGGRLIAYVTHRAAMGRWAFTRHGTHRLFDEEELVSALMEGGFAREQIVTMPCSITRSIHGILVRATV
jgi:ubiquinone/menaquinone biosynthesis C-methylase UbiE